MKQICNETLVYKTEVCPHHQKHQNSTRVRTPNISLKYSACDAASSAMVRIPVSIVNGIFCGFKRQFLMTDIALAYSNTLMSRASNIFIRTPFLFPPVIGLCLPLLPSRVCHKLSLPSPVIYPSPAVCQCSVQTLEHDSQSTVMWCV
jgi:hypothetical protein